jgi:hypothetical protein
VPLFYLAPDTEMMLRSTIKQRFSSLSFLHVTLNRTLYQSDICQELSATELPPLLVQTQIPTWRRQEIITIPDPEKLKGLPSSPFNRFEILWGVISS